MNRLNDCYLDLLFDILDSEGSIIGHWKYESSSPKTIWLPAIELNLIVDLLKLNMLWVQTSSQ